ncbi:integrase [Sporosarcina ureae]|uniref:integrase n=1 Tax=Sporosarcina ureae TaxID=1571 RepID=UPI0028ADAC30|nr:integrase [Sporosarcina ureae]
MNEQVLSLNVPQCINEVMRTVNMKEELREVHDGINMSYNFIGKYIGYDIDRLKIAYGEIESICLLEDYIKTITMHELGHAIDLPALEASLARTIEIFTMKKSYSKEEVFRTPDLLKMLIEEDEMNLAFEITAWDNASELNEKYTLVHATDFNAIRKHSMASYHRLYQHDLQAYHQLINEKSAK